MSVHKLPVRLKDIAEKSGFSIGTVQRALSNTGGYSPESQKKILQIAQEMGYTANPAASALRRSTITIAVVLPKPDGDNTFFFEYIWQGIHVAQADFAVHNLNIEEHYTQSKAETVALLQKMLEASSRPQALITRAVNSPVFYELIVKLLDAGMCVFVVNSMPISYHHPRMFTPPESMSLGLIAADIFSVAHKEATGSVLLLGGDRNQSRQANRATDFCKAMAVRCPNLSIIELHAFNNPENLHHLLSHSLRDIPMLKGLYAVSSRETRAMCLAIQQAGLSGQITAVGTDVFPALLPYFEDDTLTASIYQYPIKRGYLSVKTVIEHLLGNELSAYRDLMPVAPVFKSTASAFCSMEIF